MLYTHCTIVVSHCCVFRFFFSAVDVSDEHQTHDLGGKTFTQSPRVPRGEKKTSRRRLAVSIFARSNDSSGFYVIRTLRNYPFSTARRNEKPGPLPRTRRPTENNVIINISVVRRRRFDRPILFYVRLHRMTQSSRKTRYFPNCAFALLLFRHCNRLNRFPVVQ